MNLLHAVMAGLIMLTGGINGPLFRPICAMYRFFGYWARYIDGRLYRRYGKTLFMPPSDKRPLGRRK